jgi:hypothetical protein
MVIKKSMKKYMSRIGQKTGTSNIGKNVMMMQVKVPLAQANQNLNSGKRLAKGRNSFPSEAVVGKEGESDGSSRGDRNAIKLLSRKIPSP